MPLALEIMRTEALVSDDRRRIISVANVVHRLSLLGKRISVMA